MPRRPPLHSASELLSPALEATVAAADPPDSDAALVALARVLAGTLDRMTRAERAAMLGQTAPQFLRVLVELEARAAKRRKPAPRAQPNALEQLRAARGSGRRPDFR